MAASRGQYWYEKNPRRLKMELDGIREQQREFNAGGSHKMKILDAGIFSEGSQKGKYYVKILVPMEITGRLEEWLMWLIFQHEHDGAGRSSSGLFGGSIRVYLFRKDASGTPKPVQNHHLIRDKELNLDYICQTKSSSASQITAARSMKRALRWIVNYSIKEVHGVDVDCGERKS